MIDLSNCADEMLVRLYSKGNNSAFDVLLNRYKDDVFSYIMFHVRDEEKANDFFQDTFVKVIMTIQQGGYVESGKFSAWVIRIARNLILDSFRKNSSVTELSNDATEVDLFSKADILDDSIEAQMLNEQTLLDVKKLMVSLPQEQHEVVFMRFYQDYSFKEIAEITGVSINTALGRMRYALLNLRKIAEQNDISLALY
ncbi:MAG: sigma-70 family RNA polymerase sigma factor [Bacteroidaceae bacterium]|nr:sigma-70 family RNA polymerase sigma factor [Bacteroidaceae bacterium]